MELQLKLGEQQIAAMLKRLDAMEGNRAVQAPVRGGRRAAVQAQVSSGVDYVHLAGPTPAEAAAAVAGGQPRER